MATKENFNAADLAQFTGTESWHRFGLSKVTCTDGAKYLADGAGAYWLLDEIALNNMFGEGKLKGEEFQVWKLAVTGSTAVLTAEDGNGHKLFSKRIPFTDFPLPEITLWFTGGVIMLPSEY